MTKTLTILCGLPGSGKSTRARLMFPGLTPAGIAPPGWSPVVVSADHYFTRLTGEYVFDVKRLGEAHSNAQCHLVRAMKAGVEQIVVDNTHSQLWEYQLADALAVAFSYEVEVIDLFDGGCTDEELAVLNTHGVPMEVIQGMRSRWQFDPRSGWTIGCSLHQGMCDCPVPPMEGS